MEKADVLIRALAPQIDAKCAEIKQKKTEKLLTRVFISAAVIMLIVPAFLIFFGISLIAIFTPIILAGAVFLISLPFLMSKGAEAYERI